MHLAYIQPLAGCEPKEPKFEHNVLTQKHEVMSGYSHTIASHTFRFANLRDLLAKASPARSGDLLAGVAAADDEERFAAQMALADVPLKTFLVEHVVPYENDEVTRLIIDDPNAKAFAPFHI